MVLIVNDSGKNTWYHLDDFEGYVDLDGNLTIKDYEEVIKDHLKLVRELDVLLNGENAAQQASLADIVAQLRGNMVNKPQVEAQQEAQTSMPIVDLSGFSGAEKDHLVKSAMDGIIRAMMGLFYSLGLSTHIDQMAFNDANGDEFLLSFRKVQGDELLGPPLLPIRPTQISEQSGNTGQLPELKPSDAYKHCNHHHELTPDHEVVNFGDGDFVANKLAIPLLKALNEAGLRTRSHHIDTAGQGWVTILLENVEFEFRKVWEIHADRKKYNGKPELYISWGLRPEIPESETENRETLVK